MRPASSGREPSFPKERPTSEQRVAIVTGASRGIGRAIASRLAADDKLIILVSRTAEALEEVRQSITAVGGSAEVRACDVGDGEAVNALVEEVASTHGRLDILVNNAGITRDGLILRMSDADFDDVIAVNLRSAFVSCRAAARPMMRGRFGRIINIGSVTGLVGNAGQANYAAAKAGLVGLTKSLAKELGSKGITANLIAPGFIETDMTTNLPQTLKDDVGKTIPVRRFGTAEEVAHAVSFAASDGASYMTGQVLVIDGGLAM
jgi:3-oxoacyl-[acyl-carrier protein] reductase